MRKIKLLVDHSSTKREKILAFIAIQTIAIPLVYFYSIVTNEINIESDTLILALVSIVFSPLLVIFFSLFPVLVLVLSPISLLSSGYLPFTTVSEGVTFIGLSLLSLTLYRLHKTADKSNISALFFILFTLTYGALLIFSISVIGGH